MNRACEAQLPSAYQSTLLQGAFDFSKNLAFLGRKRYNSRKMGGKPLQTTVPKQQKSRILPILFIVVFFALLFVPGLSDLRGLFLGLLAGVAFSFYAPLSAGAITLGGIVACVLLAQGDWMALAIDMILTLPLCILLGCFFRKPSEPPVVLLSGLLTETAGLSVALVLSSRHAGFSVLDRFFDDMNASLTASFAEIAAAGALPENISLAQLQSALSAMVETYRLRVPFFLLTGAAGTAVLLFLAILWIRRACGEKSSPLPPFRYFRMTRPAVALILVSFVGSLLLSGTVATAFENLYSFLTLMMVVSGLAYAAYWLKQKGLSVPLRGLILVVGTGIALFFSILWYLLLMLGLTDALWNLRALRFSGRKE